jgi:hypothetical protein
LAKLRSSRAALDAGTYANIRHDSGNYPYKSGTGRSRHVRQLRAMAEGLPRRGMLGDDDREPLTPLV